MTDAKKNHVLYSGSSIAKELEYQLLVLSDPKTKWVRRTPRNPGEACLVDSIYFTRKLLNQHTIKFLDSFIKDYCNSFTSQHYNDVVAKNRQEVLWMLEEAIDQAKWEEV